MKQSAPFAGHVDARANEKEEAAMTEYFLFGFACGAATMAMFAIFLLTRP